VIAALLPLLEALGAEGGASATLGGGLEGLLGGAGRALGGTSKFGSQKELGEALRQISDLGSNIQAAQEAMEQKRQQQEAIGQKARDDERQYAFSDPAHKDQMADLARQQQAHAEEIRNATRQMNDLRARAAVTTDPAAARQSQIGQASSIIGLAQSAPQARSLLYQIVSNTPGPVKTAINAGQVATNLGSNLVTPTSGQIIGEAASDFGGIAKNAIKGNIGNLAVELSKLPAHIVKWSESLVESQRSISKFNGTLAMTFAQQERRGIVRAIESGERTGGATSELSNSLQDLYDQLQPIKDEVTVVVSKALTHGVQLLTQIVKAVEAMAPAAQEVQRWILGMSPEEFKDYLKSFENLAKMQMKRAGNPITAMLNEARNRDPRRPFGSPRR
jgi:hypothetical protein